MWVLLADGRSPLFCEESCTVGGLLVGRRDGLAVKVSDCGDGVSVGLWNSRVGGISNGLITYELDGKQYVVAAAGSRMVAFVLND